ncbi:ubiquinol oxidase subunit II [Bradyrhizobium sp. STM 3562]|uniref:ubiquinol oxidase subunit II n=1 Tax=Bradyrhizobium sp. STM 3562 TaxID=578924 RepID=UPI00388F5B0A
MNRLKILALLPFAALLSGCDFVVLSPSGDIAAQQRDLVVISTVLMLLIIVPVMTLTALFAWRYRSSNTTARYEPEWHHSTKLELVIWSAPLLIIICLGALTWMGTHLLDPFRPLQRIAAGRPVDPNVKPLTVDVVALDWKWLFIYPEQGIATVNEVAAPVDRPIDFHITASSVMNSFYIPALAGQIYAMPGMDSQLHAVINKAGTYKGFSANYSGAGFSSMRFTFKGLSDKDFDGWIAGVKAGGGALEKSDYLALERPSLNEPVRRYASVDKDLYRAIVNMCVEPGKMCVSDMMAVDEKGGLGLAGIRNTLPLAYDKYARRGAVFGAEPSYVAALCSPDAPRGQETVVNRLSRNVTPLPGSGVTPPLFTSANTSSTSFLLGLRRKSES